MRLFSSSLLRKIGYARIIADQCNWEKIISVFFLIIENGHKQLLVFTAMQLTAITLLKIGKCIYIDELLRFGLF